MKNTLLVFVILGLVLAGMLGVRYHQRRVIEKQEASEVSLAKMTFSFDPMKVTECSVTSPAEKVELKKENGVWRITDRFGGVLADASVFLDFLVSLKKINTEERSNDKALLKQYGLGEDEAIRIQLKTDGKLLEDLYLGVKATDQHSNFIRRKDSVKVYAVTEDILTYMGFAPGQKERKLSIDKWADKRVLTFDPAAVKALTIGEGKSVYANILRDDEKAPWTFVAVYPYAPDQEKIKNYLQMLSSLRGGSLVEVAVAEASDKDWTASLTMKDGTTLSLMRKATKDGALYVRVAGRGYALKVAPYHFENMTKSDGGFFVDNVLGVEEDKVSGLYFNDILGKKKETLAKRIEGAGDAAKIVWNAGKKRVFTSEKVKDLLSALKGLRLETTSAVIKKGGEVFSFILTEDKTARGIRVWNKPSSVDGNACFALQIDKSQQSYCVEENSLKSLVNAVSRLYEPAVVQP